MDFTFSITLVITAITVIVSLLGFNSQKVIEDLIFYGPAISKRNQYYRFITCGFIHADFMHLAFNMLAFYTFGIGLEKGLFANPDIFGNEAPFYFIMLYIGGLIISSVPDYFKHKDDYHFRSLGASGAVSAIIFSCIVLYPTMQISFFFIPIRGWIFGLIYLGISAYLNKQGGGNINHGAHLWGAIFGIAYTLLFVSLKGEINVLQNFITAIRG
ncbi:rhomboid family intramembrane serine protease [Niabella ginsengisoli]|uniref:Rhomboid family intramembrane serine protease n=1 Tax=Niabella ginsengisoli TaxID=522298 RepID=A0ABS9SKE0_9BACT|nr:rhomboid family intramembrane serine protease [Niabella ginsengisoli]MCH5598780.1 rhomboid family intramembrane serine protease [Niabella ginsengisoli]